MVFPIRLPQKPILLKKPPVLESAAAGANSKKKSGFPNPPWEPQQRGPVPRVELTQTAHEYPCKLLVHQGLQRPRPHAAAAGLQPRKVAILWRANKTGQRTLENIDRARTTSAKHDAIVGIIKQDFQTWGVGVGVGNFSGESPPYVAPGGPEKVNPTRAIDTPTDEH